jgi:hypothetical protein
MPRLFAFKFQVAKVEIELYVHEYVIGFAISAGHTNSLD